MARIYNFSAGPATMPDEILEEAQAELLDFRGSGMSIMESSHRGPEYSAVHDEATANLRTLLGLGDDHSILFLPGGASAQFAMIPLNLLPPGQTADYVNSGSWAKKAIAEARIVGDVHVAATSAGDSPARMPTADELVPSAAPAYRHITSNETIEGTQWKSFPDGAGSPLVADMSSDILSRPFDATDFGLIYAGAQKNLGPSGLAVVVVRNDVADRVADTVPRFHRYKTFIDSQSLYNTPPCFGIYMIMLMTRWIMNIGLEELHRRNVDKAARIYAVIDAGDFYTGTAARESRSDMNITFRLPSEELEKEFVAQAKANGMSGLKGHRSVGGIRASVYNSFPLAGVDALVELMTEFARANG